MYGTAGSSPGLGVHVEIDLVRRSTTASNSSFFGWSKAWRYARRENGCPGFQLRTSFFGGSWSVTMGNRSPLGRCLLRWTTVIAVVISCGVNGSSGPAAAVEAAFTVRTEPARDRWFGTIHMTASAARATAEPRATMRL